MFSSVNNYCLCKMWLLCVDCSVEQIQLMSPRCRSTSEFFHRLKARDTVSVSEIISQTPVSYSILGLEMMKKKFSDDPMGPLYLQEMGV